MKVLLFLATTCQAAKMGGNQVWGQDVGVTVVDCDNSNVQYNFANASLFRCPSQSDS